MSSIPNAENILVIMLRFSDMGNTEAWATSRRISRPAAGLAIIPTELDKLLKGTPDRKTSDY